MARIECTVKWDGWKATPQYEVLRIDPGDELIFNSDYPDSALHWTAECPFDRDTMPEVYPLPLLTVPSPTLHQVKNAGTLTSNVVECGSVSEDGQFTKWRGGFEDPGTHAHGGHRG